MSGVHRALAADIDLDGDQDVVACALVPDQAFGIASDLVLDSLIWLEQTGPGEFKRHVLDAGRPTHAAMSVADFDGDGDVDVAVGNYATAANPNLPVLEVWWNLQREGS
jgi:hypothetical protein